MTKIKSPESALAYAPNLEHGQKYVTPISKISYHETSGFYTVTTSDGDQSYQFRCTGIDLPNIIINAVRQKSPKLPELVRRAKADIDGNDDFPGAVWLVKLT